MLWRFLDNMKIDKYTYFVSGAEPDNYFEMIMQETNTCLMSYQILQRKGKKFLHNRISKFPEMKMPRRAIRFPTCRR
jgi:hypothetical protein